MNETMNINYVGGNTANYRLRSEPVQLTCKTYLGHRPDGDGWEELWDVTVGTERSRTHVKPGLPRKQAAARAKVPINTIKVVPRLEAAPKDVVMARLAEASPREMEIAKLQAEIKRLLGLL